MAPFHSFTFWLHSFLGMIFCLTNGGLIGPSDRHSEHLWQEITKRVQSQNKVNVSLVVFFPSLWGGWVAMNLQHPFIIFILFFLSGSQQPEQVKNTLSLTDNLELLINLTCMLLVCGGEKWVSEVNPPKSTQNNFRELSNRKSANLYKTQCLIRTLIIKKKWK